jgi:beta-glucosidase
MMNPRRHSRAAIVLWLLITVLSGPAGCKDMGTPSAAPEAGITERVDALLAQMTLDEKVGQMAQVDRSYLEKESDIRDYYLGSVLSGGGSTPSSNAPSAWADMYDRYQSYALQTRLKIPIIYGIDAVHGHNNVVGAVIFPHNIGMGCTRNPALVERAAAVTADEVTGTGLDWTFAPCIAVPRDERWGRTYEGFGETPELTAQMAAASVRGFQQKILACAKHYLGDGGTTQGHNEGNTECNEADLRAIHLPGYKAAVDAGVGSIMVSFSSWNGVKMHANRYLLTTVLKEELGFTGFLVSDWGGVDQLPGDYSQKLEASINAGLDMIMIPQNYKLFTSTMKALVTQGRVPVSRVDDAVRRILIQKFRFGLFDHPYTDRSYTPSVGSAEHRAVAREAVRQSLVLLRNTNNILPLSKNLKRIHVSGKSMDNIGNQCGGWTISWQGSSGHTTPGQTILQAVRKAVSPGTTVTTSLDGTGAEGADVGIVVIGETPYAEGMGDRTDLSLADGDVSVAVRVKAAGVPTIVILISGRPMIIEPLLGACDGFIAAWLPGTQGDGVADVLFGDYAPTGKLSHSWPRSMSQIPVNVGDPTYNPLFPYGFGLTY